MVNSCFWFETVSLLAKRNFEMQPFLKWLIEDTTTAVNSDVSGVYIHKSVNTTKFPRVQWFLEIVIFQNVLVWENGEEKMEVFFFSETVIGVSFASEQVTKPSERISLIRSILPRALARDGENSRIFRIEIIWRNTEDFSHCIFLCNYHIVLVTKYRRKIFNEGILHTSTIDCRKSGKLLPK